MNPTAQGLLTVACLMAGTLAHAASDDAVRRDVVGACLLDALNEQVAGYCRGRVASAPEAFAAWRRDHGLSERCAARFDRATLATDFASTEAQLAKAPAAMCGQMVAYWKQGAATVRTEFPLAFGADAARVLAPAASPSARPAAPEGLAPPAQAEQRPAPNRGDEVVALVKELSSLGVSDMAHERTVGWCTERAPERAAAVRDAWLDWRDRHGAAEARFAMANTKLKTDRFSTRSQVDEALKERVDRLAEVVEGIDRALATQTPATFCAQEAEDLRKEDLRAKSPRLFGPDRQAAVRAVVAEYSHFKVYDQRRPVGTLYTVAQLDTLAAQWKAAGRDKVAREAALKAVGRIYVEGVVARRDDTSYMLEFPPDTFGPSAYAVVYVDLSAQLGRRAVVGGLPGGDDYRFTLQEAAVVYDSSGLTRSPLPNAPMHRLTVDAAKVRAQPGRGLDSSQFFVLYHSSHHMGSGGLYEFEYDTHVLLHDGWAYRRDILPVDLDVAASRQLEPQMWGRWKKSGLDYLVQWQDDYGKPKGEWSKLEGRPVDAWPRDHRMAKFVQHSSYSGSIAMGSSSTRLSFSFKPDGRFEKSQFSRSMTGSMMGFSGTVGSRVVTRGAEGSRSSVGAGAPGVAATAGATQDDGADYRGTYRLDGYMLELRYDNGQVRRSLSFPIDKDGKSLWFSGQDWREP